MCDRNIENNSGGDRQVENSYKLQVKPKGWQVGIVLVIGVLGVSMAAIFIRLTMTTAGRQDVCFSLFIAASRLLIASLILLPTWSRVKPTTITRSAYLYAIAAGICLGLHFATWITSLAFTSIAASTTLVTTNPIWVAILSRWWFKERLSKPAIVGIGVALAGGMLIAFSNNNISSSSNPLLGNILALLGAIMASLYLVLGGQAQRQGLKIGNYVAIAYTSAAIFLLPLPLLFGTSYFGYSREVYGYLLLMAVVSQLIGHTSFNWALRWISPTFIALSILFEPIVSSYLGLIVFAEIPSMLTIIGGAILLSGVSITAINRTTKN